MRERNKKLTAKEVANREVELDKAVRQRLRSGEELVPIRDEDGNCIECGVGQVDVNVVIAESDPDKVLDEEHAPGCIMKRVEREIQLARGEWLDVTQKIPPAQAEYDAAQAAEAKYDNYDKPLPEKVAKRTDHALQILFGWMDRKVVLENTIKKLQSPAEHERRRETNNRLKEVRKVAASNNKKQTARDQGVPASYLGANGNFKPGLDARYKSDLITSALGEKIGDKGLHQFTRDSALERLEQRGWLPHLEKAKKSRDAKAAKKAANVKATPRKRSTSRSSSPRKSSSRSTKKAA